jgi:hypothetical protein
MASDPLSPGELARIEADLLARFRAAEKAYEQAKRESAVLNRITEDLGMNHPDGAGAIQNASRGERVALKHYTEALTAFHDFILHGKIPEDRE